MYRLFKYLSEVRGARILHPAGTVYSGVVSFDAPEVADVFQLNHKYATQIRVSRSVGFPSYMPDLNGLAFKFLVGMTEQDFILIKTARLMSKLVLVPTYNGLTGTFSSILPFKLHGDTVLFGVRQVKDHTYEIVVASRFGKWRRIGELTIGEQIFGADTSIKFNAFHNVSGIRPAGFINRLRKGAY